MDDDCTACRAAIRHDHRPTALDCPHARHDGSWRGCCADHAAGTVEITAALLAARRGHVPANARELVAEVDPVGVVWRDEEEREARERGERGDRLL